MRTKFSGQMKGDLLKALRDLSETEGRHLHILLEEAVQDLLDKRGKGGARPHVMAAYQESVQKYDSLYRKLISS